jgi:hypothetical protein
MLKFDGLVDTTVVVEGRPGALIHDPTVKLDNPDPTPVIMVLPLVSVPVWVDGEYEEFHKYGAPRAALAVPP